MEFQDQENLVAELRKPVDGSRAFGCVEPASNFEESRRAPQFPRERESGAQAVVIGGDDYSP